MAEAALYREVYEFEADVYRITPEEEEALRYRRLLVERLMPPAPIERVLDVGCGDGSISNDLLQRTRGVVLGTDLAFKRVSFAARRTPGARFAQSSIYRLPFPDGAFSLVTCTDLLEHLDEPDRAFRELARVSSRWVLVTVPYKIKPEKILCPHCLEESYLYGHQHDIGPAGVERMVRSAGARVERAEHVIPMFECRRYKLFPPLKWLIWNHFKNSGTYGALVSKA